MPVPLFTEPCKMSDIWIEGASVLYLLCFLAVYTNQPIKTASCSYVVPDHLLISLVFDSWGDESRSPWFILCESSWFAWSTALLCTALCTAGHAHTDVLISVFLPVFVPSGHGENLNGCVCTQVSAQPLQAVEGGERQRSDRPRQTHTRGCRVSKGRQD